MKNKTVGLDESELNARGDHVSPTCRQRSMKRESPDFSYGTVKWSVAIEEKKAVRRPDSNLIGA